MLDNLQLIPGEAFTATSKLGEKLIDKVSNAIGWAVIPKNTKKYQLEAEEYLIEQIKKDDKMPALAKAAYISNTRKLIKHYINKCDIFIGAKEYLSTEESYAKIEELSDEWLEHFFDRAQNVDRDDMKIIWSRLLAKEVENPNSVSKQLLHILSIMDYSDAEAFKKLVDFTVNMDEGICVIISIRYFDKVFSPYGLRQGELIRLIDAGLIQYNSEGFYYDLKDKITYFDNIINVEDKDDIAVGNIRLSKAGEELISIIINDKKRIADFEEYLPKILLDK